MALPKQIQNQIKHGKEIEQAIRDSVPKTADDTTQSEIDALIAEVDNTPEKEVPAPAPDVSLSEVEKEPAPSNVVELEQKPREDWKQKYSVLKGKYDAEVPRLSEQLRTANAQISSLGDSIAALQRGVRPGPDAQPLKGTAVSSELTFSAEEIADYGEDLLEIIGRKAKAVVAQDYQPLIDRLQKEVHNLEQQVGTTNQRVSRQEKSDVFSVLDSSVKDWRTVNVSQEYLSWLSLPDPFSGRTRKDLLMEAFDAGDAHRVKTFFESYLQENAAVTPAPTGGQPGNNSGTNPTLALGDYVAPGTPKTSGQAGAPQNKRMWKRAEIQQFYSQVQKGHWKDRQADKVKMDIEIVSAINEGRIID